jgi:hypothetical protein
MNITAYFDEAPDVRFGRRQRVGAWARASAHRAGEAAGAACLRKRPQE